MNSWKKAIGYGVLMWLVPFAVAFGIFIIHDSNRPLFESIMAVAIAATATVLGLRYLKHVDSNVVREAVMLGLLWLGICVLIDAPLMLLDGPMQMSIMEYVDDIGVTYLMIPVVTWGVGVARSWGMGGGAA